MWFVYILKCKDTSLYTGITNDLDQRVVAHNAGKGARYTAGRGPVSVVYSEEVPSRSAALKREYAIKQLSRIEKRELIKTYGVMRKKLPQKSEFILRITDNIKAHTMLRKGDRILLAVSGGRDSVTLAHVMHMLSAEYQLILCMAHLNHSLRGKKATRDERFARNLAARLSVPFYSDTQDVKGFAKKESLSVEEAARICRYTFFCSLQKKLKVDAVATGHNLDDQAETLFMRICKGTGIEGLSGVRPVGAYRGLKVIRPLLCTARKEIDAFIKNNSIEYVEDETNAHDTFLRNTIRHTFLPDLEKKINPQIKEALSRLATIAHVQTDFLHTEAHKQMKRLIKHRTSTRMVLKKKSVQRLHPAMQYALMQAVLKEIDSEYDLTFEQWGVLAKDIASSCKTERHIGGFLAVRHQYDEIVCERISDSLSFAPVELTIGKALTIAELGVIITATDLPVSKKRKSKKKNIEYVDYDRVQLPLIVRSRNRGDSFVPLGMRGKKKVKDILIDKKVPHYEREKACLICSGNDIVWLAPYVISNACKITSQTKKLLRISIRPLTR